jgi:hypothetical protein
LCHTTAAGLEPWTTSPERFSSVVKGDLHNQAED